MTKPTKSPEQIEAMREELRAFDEAAARQITLDAIASAKPLIDLVGSDGFKAVEAALPALDTMIGGDRDRYKLLGLQVDALRNGLAGVRQAAASVPALPVEAPLVELPA